MSEEICPEHPEYDGEGEPPDSTCTACLDIQEGADDAEG
jgi:hypothetical protein